MICENIGIRKHASLLKRSCLKCLRFEEAYGDYVGMRGVYLSLLDLAMLSWLRKKNTWVIIYDDEFDEKPSCRNLVDMLVALVKDVPGLDLGPLPASAPYDPSSSDTWILAACAADFKRGAFLKLNHYVPVYSKESLGAEWANAVCRIQDRAPDNYKGTF